MTLSRGLGSSEDRNVLILSAAIRCDGAEYDRLRAFEQNGGLAYHIAWLMEGAHPAGEPPEEIAPEETAATDEEDVPEDPGELVHCLMCGHPNYSHELERTGGQCVSCDQDPNHLPTY